MKLNYFGKGPFLEFFENGSVLSHGEHTIDCARLQDDSQVIVDVCMDGNGDLTLGADGSAATYVANVIIPARQYQEQVVLDENDNPVPGDDGQEQIKRVALELDMGQVTGNLWTMPVLNKEEIK
jgi:hypothetical protein